MSPNTFKLGWTALLLMAALVVLCLMYKWNTTTREMRGGRVGGLAFPERNRHVRVTLSHELQRPSQLFSEAFKQVHQQLGDRRDVTDRFDEVKLRKRKEHIKTVCPLLKNNTNTFKATEVFQYYDQTNILYCPMAKVASKFWNKMLHVLATDDHVSPFEIGHSHPQKVILTSVNKPYPRRVIKDGMESAFKFMFARDPYKRIFSSYVDKFVSPNSLFWRIGRNIVFGARESPSNKSLECGHDVTFNELVQSLLAKEPEKFNVHFRPVYLKCDVCHIQYDVIGKVETFKHDVMYIINKTSEKDILFKDFTQENNVQYIIFNAKRAFDLKKKTLKCTTDHVVHLRLWRQIQISGLIEKHDNYPLTPEESRRANRTTVINLLLNAYHRSPSGTKSNSKEAFLQAYSQVSLEDMEKLRLKYLTEFMLFDYDDRPDELFKERKTYGKHSTPSFDYFNILKLDS